MRFDADRETPAYDRGALPPGATVEGPAVVEGPDATTVIRPSDELAVADDGTLRIEVGR